MTIKKCLSTVCGVVLLIACMGCDLVPIEEEICDPFGISFEPQFVIENKRSIAASISLKKAYYYSDGVWDIISETGNEEGSPVNVMIPAGADDTLETWVSRRADIEVQVILSFALTIDGRHYVGWAAGSGTGELQGIAEYGLGSVSVVPGEINPFDPKPVLISKLTPAAVEHNENSADVTATYRVTVTDGGVRFALEKQSVID